MIRLNCDYLEGCHPAILRKLTETNMEQTVGYGMDPYCDQAAAMLRETFACPEAAVHFLVGGTQANTTVIAAALRPYEGVLCAETGHINVHETGAIESSGHKCLALPHRNGKITAEQVAAAVAAQGNDEHIVKPGMVYISLSTELGTLYTLSELQAMYRTCQQLGLYLFIDGARLGYALAAEGNDLSLKELAALADVFYIGGTKVGALFGEAVVVRDPKRLPHLFPLVKQHGALLAKGRLLGLQFEALFTNGLYEKIGQKAVAQALRIREAFRAKGYEVVVPSPTNQQFFRLPNEVIDRLKQEASFELWGPRGATETVVRFVTGWSTTDEDVDQLIAML